MAKVESVLKLLDKWPLWKRIKEAPGRLDALEQRVAELAGKLGDDTLAEEPIESCPNCGLAEYRVAEPTPGGGVRMMRCGSCGFEQPTVE